MEITAKKKINDEERAATIHIELGENLENAIELFTADVVFSNFVANAKITAQAAVRRMLETGLDSDAIQTRMNDWKPGQKLERIVDPVASFKAKLAGMDEGERMALLQSLMEG